MVSTVQLTRRSTGRRVRKMLIPLGAMGFQASPARRFGFSSRSGLIAANMDADVTIFRGDPALDITAFSRVSYTIRAGKIIFRASH